MLNELSDHVDSTEGRLATARRKLEDFIRKSEGTLSFSPSPPPPIFSPCCLRWVEYRQVI
jgi:hypothetical protein